MEAKTIITLLTQSSKDTSTASSASCLRLMAFELPVRVDPQAGETL
jgi:hypothetical protein